MNAQMEYKGYLGSAEVDLESRAVVGRLLHIRDLITYSASTVDGIESAFHEAVDDYLQTCAERGEQPDEPCKGTFNVRVGPERHRKLVILASKSDCGLNEMVCTALDGYFQLLDAGIKQTVMNNYYRIELKGEPRMFAATGMPSHWEQLDERTQH